MLCCHGTESLNARLVDGPGKCAGRVEIQYKGRWRQVRKDSEWTDDNSNSVCKEMECGKMRKSTGPGKFSQGSGDFLSNPVKCNKDANNISACDIEIERSTAVGNNEAVGVICEGEYFLFASLFVCFSLRSSVIVYDYHPPIPCCHLQ